MLNGLTQSTLSAYLTGWSCFKAYHSFYQLTFPIMNVWSICNFVTHAHSNLKIRASSIQTYLSEINFIHKLATGDQCQYISHPHVSRLIKGLWKQEPVVIVKRLPLTSDLLSRCIHTLCSGYLSTLIDQTLECMFLLAFFGFLRCSESAFNPVFHPCLSDITAHPPDSLIFTLKRSRTDLFGESFPINIFRLNSFASSVHMSHFQNMFFQERTTIHLLKNHSFSQKKEKWPRDFGLTNTSKIFSAPPSYLPNTTPSIPSRLEQPQRLPAQASQTRQSES